MHIGRFVSLNMYVSAKKGCFPVCYRSVETFGYMKKYVRQCKVKRVSQKFLIYLRLRTY